MIGCGTMSVDGSSTTDRKRGVDFTGCSWLTLTAFVGISRYVGVKRAPGIVGSPTACLPIYAHVVPDNERVHSVLLIRDSWSHFPVRTFWDVNDTETMDTSVGREGGSTAGGHVLQSGLLVLSVWSKALNTGALRFGLQVQGIGCRMPCLGCQ